MTNKNKQKINKINWEIKKKIKPVVRWSLLVLFQAFPFAQENEEGVPTNKAKKQGVRANNKTTK
jgi:hypothetical protein